MKKSALLLLAFFLSLPTLLASGLFSVALAADGGLLPCGVNGKMCTVCDILVVANNIFNFAVKVSIGLAILAAVVAGILYITSSGQERLMMLAKTALKFTLIGFILSLLAWVFVNVIAHSLGYESPSGEWWDFSQASCQEFKANEPKGISGSRKLSGVPRLYLVPSSYAFNNFRDVTVEAYLERNGETKRVTADDGLTIWSTDPGIKIDPNDEGSYNLALAHPIARPNLFAKPKKSLFKIPLVNTAKADEPTAPGAGNNILGTDPPGPGCTKPGGCGQFTPEDTGQWQPGGSPCQGTCPGTGTGTGTSQQNPQGGQFGIGASLQDNDLLSMLVAFLMVFLMGDGSGNIWNRIFGGGDPSEYCYDITNRSDCESDSACEWDYGNNRCIENPSYQNCYRYSNRYDCENKSSCEWDDYRNQCVERDLSQICSRIYSRTSCENRTGCEWDYDLSRCIEERDCEAIYAESECRERDDCEWDDKEDECEDDDADDKCNDLNKKDCEKDDDCEWDDDDDICRDEDYGENCEEYNKEDCDDDDECEWDSDEDVCREEDYEDQDCQNLNKSECDANSDCEWDSDDDICRDEDEDEGCEDHTRAECDDDSDCEWDSRDDICRVDCTVLIKSECDDRNDCGWDDDDDICRADYDEDCKDLTKEECTDSDSCKWDSDDDICRDEDEAEDCKDFNKSECDDADSCEWDEDGDVCREENDENGDDNIEPDSSHCTALNPANLQDYGFDHRIPVVFINEDFEDEEEFQKLAFQYARDMEDFGPADAGSFSYWRSEKKDTDYCKKYPETKDERTIQVHLFEENESDEGEDINCQDSRSLYAYADLTSKDGSVTGNQIWMCTENIIYDNASGSLFLAHELGHAVGKLQDERDYIEDIDPENSPLTSNYNCYKGSSTKSSSDKNKACSYFEEINESYDCDEMEFGCNYSDQWLRSTPNGVMTGNPDATDFGLVCTQLFRNEIKKLTGPEDED